MVVVVVVVLVAVATAVVRIMAVIISRSMLRSIVGIVTLARFPGPG